MNFNTIIANQTTVIENQMRIMEQLANQETMIQLLCQHISDLPSSPTAMAADQTFQIPDTFPINSQAKMD